MQIFYTISNFIFTLMTLYNFTQLPLEVKQTVFNVHGSVHRKNILIYIQQDVMLYSLFCLESALHVSGGTTTHHECKQLHL